MWSRDSKVKVPDGPCRGVRQERVAVQAMNNYVFAVRQGDHVKTSLDAEFFCLLQHVLSLTDRESAPVSVYVVAEFPIR